MMGSTASRLRALRERATKGEWQVGVDDMGHELWAVDGGSARNITKLDLPSAHLITVLANVCEAIATVVDEGCDCDDSGLIESSRANGVEHWQFCPIAALDRALRDQLDKAGVPNE